MSSNFRWVLRGIARHIDSETVKNLKFMCNDVIVASRRDQINTAIDLFQELEGCGKISDGDFEFLITLLRGEGKSNLAEILLQHSRVNHSLQESASLPVTQHQQLPAITHSAESLLFVDPRNLVFTFGNQHESHHSTPVDERNRATGNTRRVVGGELHNHNVQEVQSSFTNQSLPMRRASTSSGKSTQYGGQQTLSPIDASSASVEAFESTPLSMSSPPMHIQPNFTRTSSANISQEQNSVNSPFGSGFLPGSKDSFSEQQVVSGSLQGKEFDQLSPSSQAQHQSQFGDHSPTHGVSVYQPPSAIGQQVPQTETLPGGRHVAINVNTHQTVSASDQQSPSAPHTPQPESRQSLDVNNLQLSSSSTHMVFSENLSVPTQAVDDHDTSDAYSISCGIRSVAEMKRLLHDVEEEMGYFESQKDKIDSTIYEGSMWQLEEKKALFKRELELIKLMQLSVNRRLQHKSNAQFSQSEVLIAQKKSIESQRCAIDNEICQQLKTKELEISNTARKVESLTAELQKLSDEMESLRLQAIDYKNQHQQKADQLGKLKFMFSERGLIYQMNSRAQAHGIAIIVNNFTFSFTATPDTLLPNCRGARHDEQNLCAIWEHLGYKICIVQNVTAAELILKLNDIALQSHENYDSFVCCILSHGYLDGVYGTDGRLVSISEFETLFAKVPSLDGKPKLFFIHAYHECIASKKGSAIPQQSVQDDSVFFPSERDCLRCCSISTSWQSRSKYISTFYEVAKKHATKHHLLDMLTIVNYIVSKDGSRTNNKGCEPAIFTILNKQVWFF